MRKTQSWMRRKQKGLWERRGEQRQKVMTQTQAWASLSTDHGSYTSPVFIIGYLGNEEREKVSSNGELCDGSTSRHQAGAQRCLLVMIRAFLTPNRWCCLPAKSLWIRRRKAGPLRPNVTLLWPLILPGFCPRIEALHVWSASFEVHFSLPPC